MAKYGNKFDKNCGIDCMNSSGFMDFMTFVCHDLSSALRWLSFGGSIAGGILTGIFATPLAGIGVGAAGLILSEIGIYAYDAMCSEIAVTKLEGCFQRCLSQ